MKQKIIVALLIIISFFLGASLMYQISETYLKKEIKPVFSNLSIDENSITNAVDKIYDSVVVIESYKNEKLVSSGTGFVYKVDKTLGFIITNHHVISDATSVYAMFSNNERILLNLLGSDEYVDIAILSVDKKYVTKVASLGNSSNINLGDPVFTVGAPLGAKFSGTITKGIISGKNRIIDVSLSGINNDWLMKVIQTDAAINPGNSGGPLVNLLGEVIGINSIKLDEKGIEGMGFALPIEDVLDYVTSLEKGEKIKRPFMGLSAIDTNLTNNNSIIKGVIIESVLENSPAFKAGLLKDDIITKINNQIIENVAEFRYYLYKKAIGDKIKITFYRDFLLKDVEVILDEEV